MPLIPSGVIRSAAKKGNTERRSGDDHEDSTEKKPLSTLNGYLPAYAACAVERSLEYSFLLSLIAVMLFTCASTSLPNLSLTSLR